MEIFSCEENTRHIHIHTCFAITSPPLQGLEVTPAGEPCRERLSVERFFFCFVFLNQGSQLSLWYKTGKRCKQGSLCNNIVKLE